MKITWLGQAGLLFEKGDFKIIIDPYLSDSVVKINPKNKRRVPVDETFLKIIPDVLICTHNHLDHTDPETLKHYLENEESVTVLAPEASWQEVRKFGGNHNYILFNRHTEVTIGDIRFKAVKAEHSDVHPIGVIIKAEGKKYYITGDTLYNTDIFKDIPNDIDVIFLPINGLGNNMNMADAKRFCKKIDAKVVVPMHCGLFDNFDMNELDVENKVVPEFYKEICLNY
ncbi:MAG: MBL fold metallo-hydrolase [Tyzzerella sp.]|nr:MBL fold metallo-hydrolase [Tyzzerella sp.]